MIDAYKYYGDMEAQHIMLLFKGNITSDLLSSILKITESKLETLDEEPKTKKRVFNILVEILQNVYHHLDERGAEYDASEVLNSAILMLGKDKDQYVIITGNIILGERVEKLKKRIDELNLMTKEELKAKYQEVLSKEGFSSKGGAGLGFIDILRKLGNKIECSFKKVDDKFSFFTLNVKA
ncbi:MAG TPA: SiaB family protein kinase [Candidatus Brocadiales bacterium]|nr:SiaB family protein kinase [Candidatus Brocadiales bacterium]